MNVSVDDVLAYLQANPLIAGALGLVLLYLLFRKTRLLLFLLLLLAVVAGVLYLIADVSGVGGAAKRRMIDQSATQEVK